MTKKILTNTINQKKESSIFKSIKETKIVPSVKSSNQTENIYNKFDELKIKEEPMRITHSKSTLKKYDDDQLEDKNFGLINEIKIDNVSDSKNLIDIEETMDSVDE
jgi:hypothetical protein